MGDPRVGMVGASYGGGIQLVAAATDCRIDVITPTITWHSLRTSLYTADTFKSGWANILTKLGTGHRLDPHVTSASAAGNDSGVLSPGDLKWFSERGPGELLSQINVPTLIIQGTVDNLFPLDQGVRNYVGIAKNGAPTAMLWFCGGHGVCLTGDGGSLDIGAATLAWLDRYLKLDPHTKNVPGFETVDQNGAVHSFDSYPVPMGSPLSATGSGSLELTADGGSGPADTTGSSDPIASLAGPVTPAKATNAVNVPITNSKQRRLLLGAPVMRITYRGTSPAWVDGPQRVFAQVVDVKTGLVVGNQVTPVKLKLDGKVHTSTSALEIVVFDARTRREAHPAADADDRGLRKAGTRRVGALLLGQGHLLLRQVAVGPAGSPHPDPGRPDRSPRPTRTRTSSRCPVPPTCRRRQLVRVGTCGGWVGSRLPAWATSWLAPSRLRAGPRSW